MKKDSKIQRYVEHEWTIYSFFQSFVTILDDVIRKDRHLQLPLENSSSELFRLSTFSCPTVSSGMSNN